MVPRVLFGLLVDRQAAVLVQAAKERDDLAQLGDEVGAGGGGGGGQGGEEGGVFGRGGGGEEGEEGGGEGAEDAEVAGDGRGNREALVEAWLEL